MFLKEDLQALSVAILADHVAGSVSIAVFCIVVCALVEQCLQNWRVTADAGYMEGCAQVFGLAVEIGAELREDIDHLDVTFIARNVQGCPPIRVTLVEQSLGQLRVLLHQQVLARLIVSLLRVDPNVPQEASLLLLILLSLGLDSGGPLLHHKFLIKKKQTRLFSDLQKWTDSYLSRVVGSSVR